MSSTRHRIRHTMAGSCFALVAVSVAAAQPIVFDGRANAPITLSPARVREVGSDTKAQLQRVTTLLDSQQWEEAVTAIRRIMEERGEQMNRVSDQADEDFVRFLPLADYCHWRMSSLSGPAIEALRDYRRRVDPLVRPWYETAMQDRDSGLLERIADRYFLSSYGDDALYALGEIALQRGDHTGARWHWERLAPSLRCPDSWPLPGAQGGHPLWLALQHANWDEQGAQIKAALRDPPVSSAWPAYPDTDVSLADARARLTLVSILEGSPRRAQIELELLRRLHPGVTGRLGGRTVDYAEALAHTLEQSLRWPDLRGPDNWSTFAMHPTRNGKASRAATVASEPAWTLDLRDIVEEPRVDSRENAGQNRRVPDNRFRQFQTGPPSIHPVVVGELLLINDSRSVHSVNIHTGQAEEIYPRGVESPRTESPKTPRWGSPHFTMTAQNHRLFARLGSPVTTYLLHERKSTERGYLLGWDLTTKKLLLNQIVPEGSHWAMDGTPVADDVNLYVAMRYTDIAPQAHVACYGMRSQRLHWRKKICSANTITGGLAEEVTHNLLTLDRGTIFFNTNLGAIASLSADKGSIRWITRYPRSRAKNRVAPEGMGLASRDLAPCILHRGMLVVAPADSDHVFALDAASGQKLWQTTLSDGDLDAVQLLGIAGEHLIASGRRLWWLDVTTGQLSRDVAENPYRGPQQIQPTGLGRGVVAGDCVYWPARDASVKVHVIDHRSGLPVQEPISLASADGSQLNLIAAKGYLFLTTYSKIHAFRDSSGVDK